MNKKQGFRPVTLVIVLAVLLGVGYVVYIKLGTAQRNSLTVEQVKNATYDFSPDGLGPVTFKDANYLRKVNEGTPMEFGVFAEILGDSDIALGDFTGDGNGDAVAFVYENSGGGNGSTAYLVALENVNGVPRQMEKFSIDGSNAVLEQLSIKDGEILLTALVHKPEDGRCCPTLRKDFRFRVTNGKLTK